MVAVVAWEGALCKRLQEAEVALRKYLAAGEKNLKIRMRYLARARKVQQCISVLNASVSYGYPRGNQGLGSLDPRCCDNKLFAGSCEPGHDGRWCDLGSANILPASLRPGDLVPVRSRLKSVICYDMWICMVILCGMLESSFRGCESNFGALQATAHALMERLLIPWLSPMKITMLSVLREIPEEIAVMEKVLEAYRSFACIREVDALPRLPAICSAPAVRNFPQEEVESSEDGEESSDYSSANESFLDEDPASENLPEVLGYWSVKRSCKRILEARMARLPIIAQPDQGHLPVILHLQTCHLASIIVTPVTSVLLTLCFPSMTAHPFMNLHRTRHRNQHCHHRQRGHSLRRVRDIIMIFIVNKPALAAAAAPPPTPGHETTSISVLINVLEVCCPHRLSGFSSFLFITTATNRTFFYIFQTLCCGFPVCAASHAPDGV